MIQVGKRDKNCRFWLKEQSGYSACTAEVAAAGQPHISARFAGKFPNTTAEIIDRFPGSQGSLCNANSLVHK